MDITSFGLHGVDDMKRYYVVFFFVGHGVHSNYASIPIDQSCPVVVPYSLAVAKNVGFHLIVQVHKQTKDNKWMRVGSTCMILSRVSKINITRTLQNPLLKHTAYPLEASIAFNVPAVFAPIISHHDTTKVSLKGTEFERLKQMINSTTKFRRGKTPVQPGLEAIRLDSIYVNGTLVPPWTFFRHRTARPSEIEWFRYSLSVVRARLQHIDGLHDAILRCAAKGSIAKGITRDFLWTIQVVAAVLSLYAQSILYARDRTRLTPGEDGEIFTEDFHAASCNGASFDPPYHTRGMPAKSGDCEDGAWRIAQEHIDLVGLTIDPKTDPVLAGLQRVAKQYTPALLLCATLGYRVSTHDPSKCLDSHMCCVMLDTRYVTQQKNAAASVSDVFLPVLVLDPTGPINPLILSADKYGMEYADMYLAPATVHADTRGGELAMTTERAFADACIPTQIHMCVPDLYVNAISVFFVHKDEPVQMECTGEEDRIYGVSMENFVLYRAHLRRCTSPTSDQKEIIKKVQMHMQPVDGLHPPTYYTVAEPMIKKPDFWFYINTASVQCATALKRAKEIPRAKTIITERDIAPGVAVYEVAVYFKTSTIRTP
tara:strand:+ start:807 stop:2600 length:1794 start_codon:yes stop_codon:yes gene_type:complete